MDAFVSSVEEIGREDGQRDLVLRQLSRKLGSLPADLRARVSVLIPDRLLDLSEALLDFTSQANLITWLDLHASAAEA